MKPIATLIPVILFSFLMTENGFAETYTVKKGDTLASVARSYYGEPVFGPRGTINKIFRLNPWAKASSSLEPGQKIALEDKPSTKVRATAPVAPPPPVAEAPVKEEVPSSNEPEVQAPPVITSRPISEQAPNVELPAELTSSPEPTPAPSAPSHEAKASAKSEPQSSREIPKVREEKPRGYFSVIPSYFQLQQTATQVGTGISSVLNSSLGISVELGWDHPWNDSFSTIVTYTIQQLSSNETSPVSGAKIVDSQLYTRAELALLNHFPARIRAGLGLAYGDHIFIENLSSVPLDPVIYKIAFYNPFAMAEWTAYESESFDGVLTLKAAHLPAQVGQGHDLTSGYEFNVQASVIQKLKSLAVIYGAGYTTENQSRTDSTETATRYDLRVGVLF